MKIPHLSNLRRCVEHRKNRWGRAAALWVVGAAATAAAGGLMLPYASQSAKDHQPTTDIAAPSDSEDFKASYSTDLVDQSNPVAITQELPTSQNSAVIGLEGKSNPRRSIVNQGTSPAIPERAWPAVEPVAESAADASTIKQVDTSPTDEPIGELNPSVTGNSPAVDRSKISMYYATDRRPIVPWSFSFWYPVLVPMLITFLGTLVAIAALIKLQQRWLWGLATLGCLALCAMVTIKTLQRYHQADRLTKLGGVIFSGLRNDRSGSDPMNYGKALVSLPPNHEVGKVERPNVFLFELKESADKHVMVRQMESLDEDDFFKSIKRSVEQARRSSVLVFIHGYNVAFEDALLRTAQLASDLEFDGVPLLYSWPSTGKLTGYLTDQENAEWSVVHLERLLHGIHERTKAERIHVIVHSMGNRVLLGAVERLALRYPSAQPMLDQVVLAAPDVDVGQFETRYRVPIHQAANQVTLYTSSGDRALLASMAVHKIPRLGLSSEDMRTFPGIVTVDVSKIDTSMLGHSYYGSKETLIKDIRALIELGNPPLQRQWLQEVVGKVEPVFWRFAESDNRPAAH